MATVPSGSQYVEALQFPAVAFLDEELAEGEVETSPLGLPRPISGNVASVFSVTTPDGRRYAVRCFVRAFDDQALRYEAISAHLAGVQSAWKVPFEYVPEGIFVFQQILPIVKMAWADGTALDNFVETNLWNGPILAETAVQFAGVLEDLRHHGIAHGDLQHGNILVAPTGQLRLIDYDGMFVPALAGVPGNELGHRNYRHPSRQLEEFGPWLDNFAGWVIYLSLAALSIDPLLWGRLDGGDERLLFREEDFVDPENSEAFDLLERHEHETVRYYGAVLRQLCRIPAAELPALSLADAPQLTPPVSEVRTAAASADDVRLLQALRTADELVLEVEEEASGFVDRMKKLATKDLLAGAPPPEPAELARLRQAVADADAAVMAAQAQRDELDREEEEQRAKAAKGIATIGEREAAELRSIGDELVRVRAELAQQDRELGAAEREERAQLVRKHAELVRTEALHKERVVAAPGIPDTVAFALARLGVRTASDFVSVKSEAKKGQRKPPPGVVEISDGRTVEVSSIGPDQAMHLMRWKRAAEERAAKAAEGKLPDAVESEMSQRYWQLRQAIQAQEPKARAEAAQLEAEATARADADRARVAEALQQVQQGFAAHRIKIDRVVANAKKDAAEARFRLQQAESRLKDNPGPVL